MKVPLLLAAVAFLATAMLITPREQVGRLEE
jgi:hypothetical protein